MKVLIINSIVGSGSTGNLVAGLYGYLKSRGDEVRVAYGIGRAAKVPAEDTFRINNRAGYLLHNLLSHLTDRAGFFSTLQTRRLVRFIRKFGPDVVNLHTLHGYWVNVSVLFKFLSEYGRPVVWTLHDCWSFTGHCAHFDLLGCEKWQTGCADCPGLKTYPDSWHADRSVANFRDKRKLFLGLGDRLTLVPVSEWLASRVASSFFKDSTIRTVHNGIDLSVFKPVPAGTLAAEHHLDGKKIVLGVANPWSGYKGLPDFVKLRAVLPEEYGIVLIGLADDQIRDLPPGILGLNCTSDVDELVRWYSAADVFVNPTYSDTYPTVNLEALACGTPVVTYYTGGSPESLSAGIGLVVQRGDVTSLAGAVRSFCDADREGVRRLASEHACRNFGKELCFRQYYDLIHQ